MPVSMQAVLSAWALSPLDFHRPSEGTPLAEFAKAERALGLRLPRRMYELYTVYDGCEFGDIQLLPLLATTEDDLAVSSASRLMRLWEWPIPEEIVIVGGDGSDGHYGLWFADEETEDPIVIDVGEAFEPGYLAIVGTDLASFLAARSAFYFVMYGCEGYETEPSLDALGVPAELRAPEPTDELYDALLLWASPLLPDPHPDPYERGWTADRINAYVKRLIR